MEELKKLYEEQIKANKYGDMVKLNEINKKIFTIREARRKARKEARDIEREKELNQKIEQLITM